MAIEIDEAINKISSINTQIGYEIIPIEDSSQRICAQNLFASLNLPKFNNSAMDGYAIKFEDKNSELKIIDTIFAGDNNKTLLEDNTCIKIMTGAKIPSNASAIIPKEDTTLTNNETIIINKEVYKNQHIRYIGEDIKVDDSIIKVGETINFSKITLLASQGITHIKVFKKPKVVVFASGEELKLHYEKAEEYQIFNSNTPTFISRLKELNCEVSFIGQAKDSIDSLKELIKNSLDADLIITSGGVSVGDADFTKEAFKELSCENIFDGLKIKPGKPTVFGKINNTFTLNLPGNPLASALVFELIGKILCQKISASNDIFLNTIETKINHEFVNKKGRTTIIPGYFDGTGFIANEKRSPGMVSILSICNSFIVLHEDVEKLEKNSKVKVLPINWHFFTDIKKDFLTYE